MGWPMAGAGGLGPLCISASFYSHGQLCPPSPQGGEQRQFRCHSQRVRAGGDVWRGAQLLLAATIPRAAPGKGRKGAGAALGDGEPGGIRSGTSLRKGSAASGVPARHRDAVHSGAQHQSPAPASAPSGELPHHKAKTRVFGRMEKLIPVAGWWKSDTGEGQRRLTQAEGSSWLFFQFSLQEALKKYIFPDSGKPASLSCVLLCFQSPLRTATILQYPGLQMRICQSRVWTLLSPAWGQAGGPEDD